MFADSIHGGAGRASHALFDAVVLAISVAAAALGWVCCSLELLPLQWMICRLHGDEVAPHAAGESCTICLEEVSSGGRLRRLPECGHRFHSECIDTWLRYRGTCPLCRVTVSPGGGRWAEWLLRLLMTRVCKWMDKHFDSNLESAFCHDSEALLS